MNYPLVGILGSGTMGKQIALLCASARMKVAVWNHVRRCDFENELQKIAVLQSRLGTIKKDEIDLILSNVVFVEKMSELEPCDLLIEAVKEDKSIKESVLSRLSEVVDGSKVIATNTSTISITGLAALCRNPACFLGVHFFNPPLSMKLVEVVRGEYTSAESISFITGFLTQLEKHPVVLPETPGFIVNRLLFPMVNEAIFLLAEGIADAKTIDSCMQMGAHHSMGPLELADFIGLDVCLSILETLVAETGDGKYRPAPLLRKYVRAGKLGRKSGSGFYSYRKRG